MNIKVTHVNATEGHVFSEFRASVSDELGLDDEATRGDLFRACRTNYGRCTSKVFVDTKSRGTIHVGWCFIKRDRYEDTNESYTRETWVSFETEPVVRSVDLGGRP